MEKITFLKKKGEKISCRCSEDGGNNNNNVIMHNV